LLCSLVVVGVCFAAHPKVQFEEFIVTHGRKYSTPEEYNLRFQIFQEKLAFIENHNSNPSRTFDVGINKFSDLSREEYVAFLKSGGAPSSECYNPDSLDDIDDAIPTNLDWRTTGNVAPVSNEGQCGSVSYVNVANQVASVLSISTQIKPVPLSSQQMMDCVKSGNDDGCSGGDPWNLYTYIEEKGLETASSYPYKAEGPLKCKYNASKVVATIDSFNNVSTEKDLMTAVATYGPSIALFDADSEAFQSYVSGIFYTTTCSQTNLDHVLLIVGYGVYNNTNYWVAQNVWGTDWGMDGYVLIERNKNTCGIATCSSYVTGAHPVTPKDY